ncbi:hypothetical protein [Methylobacterium planeticum]|uniref:Uncharacterized protein n=1 Tax=Methylobacterium planeticum TaxID=2615211 RepID=A0A6N6MCC5_9HYPH|nr:hypothetical protein [Methylobacterium planeticum]KAB1068278.1 hypothetical protein F6X51_27015 [Methylobacterium planeticum]
MTGHDPDAPAKTGGSTRGSPTDGATAPDAENAAAPLPPQAEQTLNQLADALGATTALLRGDPELAQVAAGETVSLYEASALLQAFLAIEKAEMRQRCLDFVQEAARTAGGA